MAGDWLKMRIDLQSHPKVVHILSATKADKFRVIGGLHAVWAVFDTHSEDGALRGYTPETMDHIIGWPGFSDAMIAVRWLAWDGDETLTMPEFTEHNGSSAKRRAEDQKRKRDERKGPQPVREASGQNVDESWTREEREKKESKSLEQRAAPPRRLTVPPEDVGAAFARLWQEYPRKLGKHEALRHFRARVLKLESLGQPDVIAAHEDAMRAAIANYRRDVAIKEREWMHGSTFFLHGWEDFAAGVWQEPRPLIPMGRKVLNEGPPEAPHHPRFVS